MHTYKSMYQDNIKGLGRAFVKTYLIATFQLQFVPTYMNIIFTMMTLLHCLGVLHKYHTEGNFDKLVNFGQEDSACTDLKYWQWENFWYTTL